MKNKQHCGRSMRAGRRKLITALGVGAIGIPFGPALREVSAREVTNGLEPREMLLLESIGDRLVPGAARSGLAAYVNTHLAKPAEECLLAIRYLDVAPEYLKLYQRVLRGFDLLAHQRFRAPVTELPGETVDGLIESLRTENLSAWASIPAPLMYLALRNDAIDVVFGTPQGFERLGRPYMPHIFPSRPW